MISPKAESPRPKDGGHKGGIGMDFKSELNAFSEGGNWWRPEEGIYDIIWRSEPESRMAEFNGEQKEQMVFAIEVKGQKFNWSMNRSKSKRSLWYQVCELANRMGGTLLNKPTRIKIVGQGRDRSYAILS